jgi:hypothetical protein
MNNEMLTTIEDSALEAVSGGGIGATIGGAVDHALDLVGGVVSKGLSTVGGALSGIGGFLSGLGGRIG